jgi:hypothetical protein
MRFNLVFDNSQDVIPFETVHNHDLIEWFINKANQDGHNSFAAPTLADQCSRLLNELHWSVAKTNEVLWLLCGERFAENHNRVDYLDQKFLNRQHEVWVKSQSCVIDIDQVRQSDNPQQAKIGNLLHDAYPDEIRQVKLAEAMIKLGYIYPYEEVNLTVHRLESFFAKNTEFKADAKWQVFDNPFRSTMTSNNDVVNFSFGYTYVGRQYYNKWKYFDTDLECTDHYNYETLEWAFQLNLDRPETVSYSDEFSRWCLQQQVPEITTQLPIANVIDLDKNLQYYRSVLYINSQQNNQAKLTII